MWWMFQLLSLFMSRSSSKKESKATGLHLVLWKLWQFRCKLCKFLIVYFITVLYLKDDEDNDDDDDEDEDQDESEENDD